MKTVAIVGHQQLVPARRSYTNQRVVTFEIAVVEHKRVATTTSNYLYFVRFNFATGYFIANCLFAHTTFVNRAAWC